MATLLVCSSCSRGRTRSLPARTPDHSAPRWPCRATRCPSVSGSSRRPRASTRSRLPASASRGAKACCSCWVGERRRRAATLLRWCARVRCSSSSPSCCQPFWHRTRPRIRPPGASRVCRCRWSTTRSPSASTMQGSTSTSAPSPRRRVRHRDPARDPDWRRGARSPARAPRPRRSGAERHCRIRHRQRRRGRGRGLGRRRAAEGEQNGSPCEGTSESSDENPRRQKSKRTRAQRSAQGEVHRPGELRRRRRLARAASVSGMAWAMVSSRRPRSVQM